MLLDNQEAAETLVSGRVNSSKSEVRKFMELCKAQIDMEICWVLGHCGIKGNEKADAMAKVVLASKTREENLWRPECIGEEFHEVLTFAAHKHHVTIHIQKLVEDWWEKNKTDRYEDPDQMM